MNRVVTLIVTVARAVRARLAMATKHPMAWPLYVDRYLLSKHGGFDRSYSYWGTYRFRVNPLTVFGHFMNLTKDLEGHIGEFGVYRGRSLVSWAKNVKLLGLKKKVYGFDSFEGYPDVSRVDTSGTRLNRRGELSDTSLESVRSYCERVGVGDVVELVKGFYPQSFEGYQHLRFSQVWVNCDLYESYKFVLAFVYPRMVPLGFIVFDEYGDSRWPGATKAVVEFFRDKPEEVTVIDKLKAIDLQTIAYVRKL